MHGDYFFDYLTHVQNFFMRTARGSVSSPDQGKLTIMGLDWPQSLKQFFINVSYHILLASLALMALRVRLARSI